MSVFLAVIGFILTIAIIVTIHEGGHCFMAKWLNVSVTRFSLGMGKVLWRRQVGETEYCISMLPLGGYVQMQDDTSPDMTEAQKTRTFGRQPRWKKALIIFAGPAVNFILAFMLYVGIGAIGTPDFASVMGQPPATTQAAREGIQEGDRVVKVAQAPVRGLLDLNFELLNHAGEADIPLTFDRQGEVFVRHFSLADVSMDSMNEKAPVAQLGLLPFMRDPVVSKIAEGAPAKVAGLNQGDRLLEINGQKVTSVQQAVDLIRASNGNPVTMLVAYYENPDEKRTLTMTPEMTDGVAKVGISIAAIPEMVTVRLGPVDAVVAGWQKVKKLTLLQMKGVSQMATGEASTKNLSGPIAIADMAGSAVKNGVVPFLEYLALISLAIGFMNLLPIPALDGGQLIVIGLEAIRGRDFSPKTKENIGKVGLVLMMLLFVFVMNNDLSRYIGG